MVFLAFGVEGMPWQIFRRYCRFRELEMGVTGQCGDGKPKLIGKLPDAISLFVYYRFLERPIPIKGNGARNGSVWPGTLAVVFST